jgi:hypothetical protein
MVLSKYARNKNITAYPQKTRSIKIVLILLELFQELIFFVFFSKIQQPIDGSKSYAEEQ